VRSLHRLVIIGIILSLIYYEITEISPGGVIVPGYIAIYINQPARIISTILISLFTALLVSWLSNHVILYGRRRFGLTVVISYIINMMISNILKISPLTSIGFATAIGYIIPGIMAQDIYRQGLLKTLSSMMVVASMIKLVNILLDYGALI